MSDTAVQVTPAATNEEMDFGALLQAQDAHLRDDLQAAALDAESQKALQAVHSCFEKESAKIGVLAQKYADVFWSAIKESRKTVGKKEQCMIGTRVRMVGDSSSLAAEWYRNRFSTSKSGQSRIYSEYIRKGKGHRYSMVAFRREPYWARQVIEMVEDRYAVLRQRAEALGKIKRALAEYENLLETPR